MYNATETVPDDSHHGSTKLHMDVMDALNRMLWAADSQDGKPGCAKWHIFDAIDAPLLCKFAIERGFTNLGDPIHSQMIHLNPQLLKRLFEEYRIRPYTIFQYPGDVVFIPAYCAHQVSCYICVLMR